MNISYIIPAFNEEDHIGSVIDAIREAHPDEYKYEIIVADNGSTDKTRIIAEEKGANVIVRPGVTVAALRNSGVGEAHGDLFIFLDADVYLTETWSAEIRSTIKAMSKNHLLLTGSTCASDENGSWIERCWFAPVQERTRVNYINSGHLIISRTLFQSIAGFNEKLETGEDADLSQRALKQGAQIVNNPKLKAIHSGFPKTIAQFFKRERWHGRGDYSSLELFLKSKPALVSVGQSLLLLICILLTLSTGLLWPLSGYLLFLIFLSAAATIHRAGNLSRCVFAGMALYPVYFFGRTMALLDILVDSSKE